MWHISLKQYRENHKLQREAAAGRKLPRSFFERDGLNVARELLGKVLVHETGIGTVCGIITEVESYMGIHDKGSHTYGGRRTERTEPMFHKGGTSYVYFTYGMYHCMNIATGQEGDPQAVLIRSVVPADDVSEERMAQLRMDAARKQAERRCLPETVRMAGNTPDLEKTLEKRRKAIRKNLADGPGKLCIAMGITKADNDIDMVENNFFYVTEGISVLPEEIREGKRIGIDYAEEAAEYLWRFYLE